MLASVDVMPAAEFDSWYEERLGQQQAGTSPLGEELWVGTCAKCHGLDGEGGYGPRIAGTDLIKNTQSVEALLRNGGILMPPVGRDWTTAETDALTTYLKEHVGNQG
jgi:mono/diheme cytochrome c family protein